VSSAGKIIIIIGPTASGKSDLAIKIAKNLDGEIISADSRQVYKDLNIGTGKVGKKEQAKIKHHLLDVVRLKNPPAGGFTADRFKDLGRQKITEIISKGKIPVIVGGTGFYIDVLLGRMNTAQVPPNPKLRAELGKLSAEQLFKRLSAVDLQRSKTIDKYNKHRLIRALEISSYPKMIKKENKTLNYDILWIGLKPKNLEKKIEIRLKKRLKQGMVNEVRKLIKSGISHRRLEDLGLEYRYISRHLKGLISKQELFDLLFSEIKKYSKRQMTWFRRNKEIKWISNPKRGEVIAREFTDS
jgi:tRNA dimethylallyltransferase